MNHMFFQAFDWFALCSLVPPGCGKEECLSPRGAEEARRVVGGEVATRSELREHSLTSLRPQVTQFPSKFPVQENKQCEIQLNLMKEASHGSGVP